MDPSLDASTPGKNERNAQHLRRNTHVRGRRNVTKDETTTNTTTTTSSSSFDVDSYVRRANACDTHAQKPSHDERDASPNTFRDVHNRRMRASHEANVAVRRRTCTCTLTFVFVDVHASKSVDGRHATHVRRASLVVHACVACRRRGRKARHDAKETHVRVRQRWRSDHRRRRTKTSTVVRDWRGSRTEKNRIGGESWWICTTTTWRGA